MRGARQRKTAVRHGAWGPVIPQAEDFREQDLETTGGLSQASQFLYSHSLQNAITTCNPDTPVHSEEQPF